MDDEAREESTKNQPAKDDEMKGGDISRKKGGNPGSKVFAPFVLERTKISLPLFKLFEERKKEINEGKKNLAESPPEPIYPVIIDVNLLYHAGREEAKKQVQKLIFEILKKEEFKKLARDTQGVNPAKTKFSQQYVFAVLEEGVIRELARLDNAQTPENESAANLQAIYHIWPDFEIYKLTTKSISTVKADAAGNAFSAYGENIYWAVMDSGIDGKHAHFQKHENLILGPDSDPQI